MHLNGAPAPAGTTVIAGAETRGRDRRRRQWLAAAGQCFHVFAYYVRAVFPAYLAIR